MEMPDEATEAPEQDVPEQDQPEPSASPELEGSDQPSGDGDEAESFATSFNPDELPEEIRPRYQQMQADYTRKTQELARQRKEAEQAQEIFDALLDPERAPAVLAALGYELDAEEAGDEEIDDYDYVDPDIESVRAEVEDLRSTLASQAEEDFLIREIAGIESQINRKLDADEINLVAQIAMDNRMPDGAPDVQTAWATIQSIVAAEKQRWVSRKKGTPRPPGRGVSEVDERVDRSDPEARRQLMENILSRELESAS